MCGYAARLQPGLDVFGPLGGRPRGQRLVELAGARQPPGGLSDPRVGGEVRALQLGDEDPPLRVVADGDGDKAVAAVLGQARVYTVRRELLVPVAPPLRHRALVEVVGELRREQEDADLALREIEGAARTGAPPVAH